MSMQSQIDSGREPKLLMPALAPLRNAFLLLYWPLIRASAACIVIVHGILKLTGPGFTGVASYMAKLGAEPAFAAAAIVILLETVGAICIFLGLFTRFFAAGLAIEMAVVIYAVQFKNGFIFSVPGGGWEFPLLLGLVFLAIAMRGGGPLSLDRRIGREL